MTNTALTRPQLAPPSRQARATARSLTARVAALGGELPLVLALVAVGLVAQGLNMFHYPSFTIKDDEGIYAAQAWAILREGRLTPYTYWYDHAPAGWMMLAGWMGLTGGPNTFGTAIDGARLLMLLLHLAMVPLLYHLARKLGAGIPAAAFGALLFSLSPLAVYYQRMVLLDTIMLFWVLLSLDLLLDGWGRLSRLVLSGLCFGLALLSKETAIFLLPAVLFVAVQQRWQHQARFAVSGWLVPMLGVASWYPLFALLKGELFPSGGWTPTSGGSADGVSLIGALLWQSSRSGGGPFDLTNNFWVAVLTDWLPRDGFLLVAGAAAAALNLLRGIGFPQLRDRCAVVAGLLGVLPLLYLGRGGIVLSYYIVFVVPFLCLNLAVLVAPLLARLSARWGGMLVGVAAVALLGGYWVSGTVQPLYLERPDQAGRESLTWIKENLPADSKIIIRDDLWVALREPGLGGPAFPNAHSYSKVALDPEIRDGVFDNDWRQVDYLLMSPDLVTGALTELNNVVGLQAFENAHLVRRWISARGSEGLHTHQVMELWKVDKPGAIEASLLSEGNAAITRRFARGGAFVAADGIVTSEAQSYATLRAVWSGDRAGFDRAWAWTRANLRRDDGLLSWQWRDGAVTDRSSATDADVDTALALLLAGQRWGDPALRDEGTRLARAIWAHEVVTVDGIPYITAGDWAGDGPIIALNPSYFAPYAYQIFREVDPEHDWLGVIESGYRVLLTASSDPLGAPRSAGLPPDWIGLERASGRFVPLPLAEEKGDTTAYGYDAPRTYWRVALHLRWSGDNRAAFFLSQAGFLRDDVKQILADGITAKGRTSAVYTHDGAVVEEAPSAVGTAGALAVLLTLDPKAAHTLNAGQLVGRVARDGDGVYWGDPTDLYAQEWSWFALAFYADRLPDLWTNPAAR